ncbi:hypothetical protein GCM10007881_61410 [Mesorhizobium huakuii]|uniref:hypothetical protein n=1 Tax=Mesorhizobium huakuii TaxID=28104 RepID=UPI00235C4906|nr:hypothetical protein [Mesorhizobium huakuii]GLQ82618.1 hypothetical protein GCM10007881_61410 [Mesorhizobium huakuii]
MTRFSQTFDDILAIMVEEGDVVPNHEVLVAWIARYPAFTDELTDYFAALAFQLEEDSDIPHLDAEHFANLAVSEAMNLLHARDSVQKVEQPVRLSRLVERAGLSEEDVAHKVGITLDIFLKLDRCRIDPIGGIPRLLVETLAATVQGSIRQVWAALSLPRVASSRSGLLRSHKRAEVRAETWEEAVQGSSLSEQEKARWLRATREGTGPP